VFGNNFNGAQLYAFSNAALAAGAATVTVVQFENLVLGDGTPGAGAAAGLHHHRLPGGHRTLAGP